MYESEGENGMRIILICIAGWAELVYVRVYPDVKYKRLNTLAPTWDIVS